MADELNVVLIEEQKLIEDRADKLGESEWPISVIMKEC